MEVSNCMIEPYSWDVVVIEFGPNRVLAKFAYSLVFSQKLYKELLSFRFEFPLFEFSFFEFSFSNVCFQNLQFEFS